MLKWMNVTAYKNGSDDINKEPEVLLWHPRTGPVIGKLLRWQDGTVLQSVNGYHGFEFLKFARINLPD